MIEQEPKQLKRSPTTAATGNHNFAFMVSSLWFREAFLAYVFGFITRKSRSSLALGVIDRISFT